MDKDHRQDQKNIVPEKYYNLFMRLYRGREDQIAIRKDDGYSTIPGDFSYDRFSEHIQLINTYAIYNLDESGKVSFSLFDLDAFPRKLEWKILLEKIAIEKDNTSHVIDFLLKSGLNEENFLIEFPTVGYHLILPFSEPIPATIVKDFMQNVLKHCNLTETPFYPRSIEKGTVGDRIQLPFRINQNTGRRSNLIRELDTFDPETYDPNPDFLVLEKVKPIDADIFLQIAKNLSAYSS